MDILVEPSFFLINLVKWRDEKIRTNFLDTVGNLFTTVREFEDYFNVCISRDFIDLIWDDPDNIFKHDKKVRQELFEPLFRLLQYISVSDDLKCGELSPPLHPYYEDQISENLIATLHELLRSCKQALFLTLNEKLRENSTYDFTCEEHGKLQLVSMGQVFDWVKYFDFSSDHFWPKESNILDLQVFLHVLRLQARSNGQMNDIYKSVSFSQSIYRQICRENRSGLRKKLITNISRRIYMDQSTASRAKSLKDEPIRNRNGDIRRFRIDNNYRIHYQYDKNGGIMLLNYGVHDDAL